MTDCTKENLQKFGFEHYTYINQFFGDLTVRNMIQEVYPSKIFTMKAIPASSEFDSGYHHILKNRKGDDLWCSVDTAHIQDPRVHKNDTLCQSYTLLKLFDKPVAEGLSDEAQKERQMEMIALYREILSNEKLLKKFNEELPWPYEHWKDFTRTGKLFTIEQMPDTATFLIKIKETLNTWKSFGYHYFIGDGTCSKKRKRGGKSRKTIKNRKTNKRRKTRIMKRKYYFTL